VVKGADAVVGVGGSSHQEDDDQKKSASWVFLPISVCKGPRTRARIAGYARNEKKNKLKIT